MVSPEAGVFCGEVRFFGAWISALTDCTLSIIFFVLALEEVEESEATPSFSALSNIFDLAAAFESADSRRPGAWVAGITVMRPVGPLACWVAEAVEALC